MLENCRIDMAARIRCAAEDLKLPDGEFKGVCRHCGGAVLVPRESESGKWRLVPDNSWCCFCGQHYRVSGGLVAVEQKLREGEA